MNLLQSLRDKISRKQACYECGQPFAAAHLHKVQFNFHGNLTQADVCDQCYAKLKGHAAPDHKTAAHKA
ncbi:MAG: hypothetical protein IT445_11405 [Phycisphaeraceae bacterium]|nr:hypothetical protein [Phycisphaeraceae bacterium]